MEDGKVMINIIYEDNHLLVVEKPCNILVQADNTGDLNLLTMLKKKPLTIEMKPLPNYIIGMQKRTLG